MNSSKMMGNSPEVLLNICESTQHYLKYHKIYILNQHSNLSVILK